MRPVKLPPADVCRSSIHAPSRTALGPALLPMIFTASGRSNSGLSVWSSGQKGKQGTGRMASSSSTTPISLRFQLHKHGSKAATPNRPCCCRTRNLVVVCSGGASLRNSTLLRIKYSAFLSQLSPVFSATSAMCVLACQPARSRVRRLTEPLTRSKSQVCNRRKWQEPQLPELYSAPTSLFPTSLSLSLHEDSQTCICSSTSPLGPVCFATARFK